MVWTICDKTMIENGKNILSLICVRQFIFLYTQNNNICQIGLIKKWSLLLHHNQTYPIKELPTHIKMSENNIHKLSWTYKWWTHKAITELNMTLSDS